MKRFPSQDIAWNAEDWIGYSHASIELIRIGFMAALDRAYAAEQDADAECEDGMGRDVPTYTEADGTEVEMFDVRDQYRGNECHECNATGFELILTPSGSEICRACFNSGAA